MKMREKEELNSRQIQTLLEEIGRKLGFETAHDPQKDSRIYSLDGKLEIGRLDVVWFKELPQLGRVNIAAFEIYERVYQQKKIKGDLVNLLCSGASICVFVAPFKRLKEKSNEAPPESRAWYEKGKPRELVELYAQRLCLAVKILDFKDVKEIATSLGIK